MNNATFDEIFTAYYTLYRSEAEVPVVGDDEYTIGLRLANEALNRWANYDDTFWVSLYTTNLTDGYGDDTMITGQRDYACSSNMKVPGGQVLLKDVNGNVKEVIKVIDASDAQFVGDLAMNAYFTRDNTGWTLRFTAAPSDSEVGLKIDYTFYKKPTEYTQGTSISEIPNAYFVVHRMLGNRFRASRNPYYTTAIADSEEILKVMQLENNAGTPANPWKVQDYSGSSWGA